LVLVFAIFLREACLLFLADSRMNLGGLLYWVGLCPTCLSSYELRKKPRMDPASELFFSSCIFWI